MLEKIVSLIAAIVSITCWFFPNLDSYLKVIICLLAVVFSLVVYLVRLYLKFRELKENLADTSQKHAALATQFEQNSRLIDRYVDFVASLHRVFLTAINNNDPQEQLRLIF